MTAGVCTRGLRNRTHKVGPQGLWKGPDWGCLLPKSQHLGASPRGTEGNSQSKCLPDTSSPGEGLPRIAMKPRN